MKHIEHAVQLSQRRAPRANLRARLQLASARLAQGKAADAGATAEAMLPDLRARGHRRWEMDALSIAARAYEDAGDFAHARDLTLEVLGVAERLGDETPLTVALDNLASQLTALGRFPEALTYRERGEAIHRRQKDNARLAFDLQNRAELLIRLGRGAEAESALKELDEGAAAGNEVFAQRARRVKQLRALRATFDERFDDAARLAYEVIHESAWKDGLDHDFQRRPARTRDREGRPISGAMGASRRPGHTVECPGPRAAVLAAGNRQRARRACRRGCSCERGLHGALAPRFPSKIAGAFAATGAASALAHRDEAQASALGGDRLEGAGRIDGGVEVRRGDVSETAGPRPSATAGRDGISSLTGRKLQCRTRKSSDCFSAASREERLA